MFDKASINLPGGKKFTVEAVNNSPENIYIQKIERNGKPYSKLYISHNDLMKGGTLKFYMGAKPNYKFGAKMKKKTLLKKFPDYI